ncbi:MAG: response regulator [Planctomycetes bacterium]|nr:response regulator [Planctomycetota bacterium]
MPYNILIVDDSRVMRQMIARTLSISGIEVGVVREAANGVEALEVLRANDIDLVLLDINMPVMDGEEFLAIVRTDAELKSIAVVVASSESNEGRIRRLRLMGAEFVHKPFRPEDLTAAVGRAAMASG